MGHRHRLSGYGDYALDPTYVHDGFHPETEFGGVEMSFYIDPKYFLVSVIWLPKIFPDFPSFRPSTSILCYTGHLHSNIPGG